jgi:hypothetical protein
VQADKACLWKVWGPGCQQCAQQKVGCSLVGMRQKIEKKESEQRLVLERVDKGIETEIMSEEESEEESEGEKEEDKEENRDKEMDGDED